MGGLERVTIAVYVASAAVVVTVIALPVPFHTGTLDSAHCAAYVWAFPAVMIGGFGSLALGTGVAITQRLVRRLPRGLLALAAGLVGAGFAFSYMVIDHDPAESVATLCSRSRAESR